MLSPRRYAWISAPPDGSVLCIAHSSSQPNAVTRKVAIFMSALGLWCALTRGIGGGYLEERRAYVEMLAETGAQDTPHAAQCSFGRS